jgi:hypothetical protein
MRKALMLAAVGAAASFLRSSKGRAKVRQLAGRARRPGVSTARP